MSFPVIVPQLYYWDVEFKDGTHLSQYDKVGNEVLIKSIVSEENTFVDPRDGERKIVPFSNYFSEYERLHGNIVNFSLLPFTSTMKSLCEVKQNMVVVVDSSIQPIIKEVPETTYVTFKKENEIDYGMSPTGDIVGTPAGRLAKFILVLVNRENISIRDTYNINFKVEKWEIS